LQFENCNTPLQISFSFSTFPLAVEKDFISGGSGEWCGQTKFLAYLYSRRQQEAWRIRKSCKLEECLWLKGLCVLHVARRKWVQYNLTGAHDLRTTEAA
jgi:hypothetical protein